MANVRELLARLNPTTVKFDIGQGGGRPDLTAQDIAAALAMVPPGLGREVFCALWWPDGASLSRDQLNQAIAREVWQRIDAQQRKLVSARLELHIAQEAILSRHAVTDEQRREITRLEGALAALARAAWPQDPEMVTRIRGAVLSELARPNHCQTCRGRRDVLVGEKMKTCPTCSGRGILPVSNRQRAELVDRDESSYRERWRPMYEWLYARVSDAERAAAGDFARALGRLGPGRQSAA